MSAVDKKTVEELRLPVWSKILIGLVVVSMAVVFGLGVNTIFGIKRLGSDAVNPVKIAQAAQVIGTFPEQLPPGFKYVFGMHIPNMDMAMVTIEHQPDKQLITLNCGAATANDRTKDLLDNAYSSDLNLWTTTAKFTDVIKDGDLKVNNYTLPYILGHTIDIQGRKAAGMVAALGVPADHPRKNILIYSLQTTDVPYNQEITMELLNSIKSF